ncbi:hypothetical protein [Nocardia farcinica]|uniref:hypothetical protein n=1 Tax=Nocardia farcinica TaxID=37329 RepID=UPI00189600CF|nr:hypothetical protein [Nocardia farcinica]MBF6187603.1 hypothetical protein [Nocardia farcinica]
MPENLSPSSAAEQPILERLAAVWESHVHDGNGAHVTAALRATLIAARAEGRKFEPFELQDRVIATAFAPFEPEAGGAMTWAVMSNAVAEMVRELRAWARAQGDNRAEEVGNE